MTKKSSLQCYQYLSEHIRLKKLAKLLTIAFTLLIIGLMLLPWQQTAFGTGKVIALSPNERQQNISAPVSGRLDKWYVHDGSHVKKGDPIVMLKDNDPNLMERLQMEKKSIGLSLNFLNHAAETAYIDVERQKKLFNSGINPRKSYEQAKFKYLDYKNRIEKTKIELAKIDVRISRIKRQLVKAPMAGTIIGRISGQESVLVKQGDILATLVPDTQSRAVSLWLRGIDIPLIHPGQKVRLQFEGWPAIQFSGWPSVAVGTFGGVVSIVDPTDNGYGRFRILVTPGPNNQWPSSTILRQGVRAHGWVLLNQVKIGFELWRRFNGFPPTVEKPPMMTNQVEQANDEKRQK